MKKRINKPIIETNGFNNEFKPFVGKLVVVPGSTQQPRVLLTKLVNNVSNKFVSVQDFCERFGISKTDYYNVLRKVRCGLITNETYRTFVRMVDFSDNYTSRGLLYMNPKQCLSLRYKLLRDYGSLGMASEAFGVNIKCLLKLLGNPAKSLNGRAVDCISLYRQLIADGYIKVD